MSKVIKSLPDEDNFYMPGEYEEHEQCWMLWPERPDNWRKHGEPAQKVFSEVAKAISNYESVTMGVSAAQYDNAVQLLGDSIRVVEMSSDDSWMRDVGPTFLRNNKGDVRGVSWQFNAWGGIKEGIYAPWNLDDKVAEKILNIEGIDYYNADFVLEGGSITVDGEGTLITTKECLLNKNRNPNLSKDEIEERLKKYLGIKKVIWIDKGIYNDETDGHVDNMCSFVKPGEVVLAWTDDETDPQYDISKSAYDVLCNAKDAKGRNLKVHKLHLPSPIYIKEDESEGVIKIEGTKPRLTDDRMAASYVNYYVANKGVIVPQFDDPMDKEAIEILKILYPNREVVGIYTREILLGGGNIHCITQQQIGKLGV